eukprot:4606479-Prymnesium_polylepis.1
MVIFAHLTGVAETLFRRCIRACHEALPAHALQELLAAEAPGVALSGKCGAASLRARVAIGDDERKQHRANQRRAHTIVCGRSATMTR